MVRLKFRGVGTNKFARYAVEGPLRKRNVKTGRAKDCLNT